MDSNVPRDAGFSGEIMMIQSERFGTIEMAEEEVLHFPAGVVGFPAEREFVLVRHGESSVVAWLQSIKTPGLALPVVSAHGLSDDYPDVALEALAERAGLGSNPDDLAVVAVLCAPRGLPATVNLLAPIVVNAATRKGAQIFLEGSRFTTRELFALPGVQPAEPAAEAAAAAG